MKLEKKENNKNVEKITDKEAEEAFVKIFKWLGEDPGREGLIETPKRDFLTVFQQAHFRSVIKTIGTENLCCKTVMRKSIFMD